MIAESTFKADGHVGHITVSISDVVLIYDHIHEMQFKGRTEAVASLHPMGAMMILSGVLYAFIQPCLKDTDTFSHT